MCVSDRRNSCLPRRVVGHEEKGERGLNCKAENHSFFVCYNLFQFICMCYYLGKINIKTTDTYSHRKKNQQNKKPDILKNLLYKDISSQWVRTDYLINGIMTGSDFKKYSTFQNILKVN